VLREIAGKAEVWIDGKLVGERMSAERKDMTVTCPAGEGERTVSVLIKAARPDAPAGLSGIVTME
jgi:beta-galactosidase